MINLKTQNEALLLKHLNNFFNKEDIPWVSLIWESYYDSDNLPTQVRKGSFWWRDILRLNVEFEGIAKCLAGIGDSVGLWEDCFLDHRYP